MKTSISSRKMYSSRVYKRLKGSKQKNANRCDGSWTGGDSSDKKCVLLPHLKVQVQFYNIRPRISKASFLDTFLPLCTKDDRKRLTELRLVHFLLKKASPLTVSHELSFIWRLWGTRWQPWPRIKQRINGSSKIKRSLPTEILWALTFPASLDYFFPSLNHMSPSTDLPGRKCCCSFWSSLLFTKKIANGFFHSDKRPSFNISVDLTDWSATGSWTVID